MLSFMKEIIFSITLMMICSPGQAQSWFWIEFTDKGPGISERLNHPESILSPDALIRRATHQIPLTASDLPVYQAYLDALNTVGMRTQLTSRWLNGCLATGSMSDIPSLGQFPFVKGSRVLGHLSGGITSGDSEEAVLDYGQASRQINMLNIPSLHQQGYQGQGMRIAVIDAGFPGVDSLEVFDSLRTRNRIVDTYDFVADTTWVYAASSHGTRVLSTISSYSPGKMIGAAPQAEILLYRTEDASREVQKEEFYWVAAVERADSIGVDIIHTSLGYNKFQDSPGYVYEDLDGNKAIITTAGDMAASKGILVVTSAGNEGNKRWKHITAPCDGDSILCVGSVTRWRDRSTFSSVGPSADGRIKPDVVAMGTATTTAGPTPRIQLSNGTSFAAPIVAGMTACIWQANRSASNMQIIDAIKLSSDQAGLPDSEYGYGIPNAQGADSLLKTGQDLTSLTIAQATKPPRGRAAIEAAESARNLANSETIDWNWNGTNIIVALPEAETKIRKVTIKRGEQHVTASSDGITRNGNSLIIDTTIWLPGTYEITIEGLDFRSAINTEIPRP